VQSQIVDKLSGDICQVKQKVVMTDEADSRTHDINQFNHDIRRYQAQSQTRPS